MYNRKEFIKLLKDASPGLECTLSILPGMNCYLFKHNKLITFNDYLALTIDFPSELNCAIPATEFLKILTSMTGEEITIAQKEKYIHISSGKSNCRLLIQDEDIYKRYLDIFPDKPKWSSLPAQFISSMSSCIIKNIPPHIQEKVGGVYIKDNEIFSTDTILINQVKMEESMEALWLSNRLVTELSKYLDMTSYLYYNSWVHFKNDKIVFSGRKLMEDLYPLALVKSSIEAHSINGLKGTLPEGFFEAVKRASIFGKEEDGAKVIKITFNKEELLIESKSPFGEFEEKLDCPGEEWAQTTINVDAFKVGQLTLAEKDTIFYLGYLKEVPSMIVFSSGKSTRILVLA
jgi:DNA polymerase III sliding clamp (beta) subunit (PCNA family)